MDPEKTSNYGEILTLLLKLKLVTEKQLQHAERIRGKLVTPVSLLNVLKDLKIVTDEMVRNALLESSSSIRIGELLIELGYLSETELTAAMNIREETNSDLKIGEILVKYNFIDQGLFNQILSIQLGFPLVDVSMAVIDREQFKRIPPRIVEEFSFAPILTAEKSPLVAFGDPLDEKSLLLAKQYLGQNIQPAIAEKKVLRETIKLLINLQAGKKINVDTKTVVGIANSIIVSSLKNDASDVHIEPLTDRLQIRFREDGVLRHYKDYPVDIIPALTSRIKIMCEADIAEKRRHQGGRILSITRKEKLIYGSPFM